ncbi:hypothetical protein [Sphingobacterium faecale]|uniref:Uncharacterized protein n=1 Tax=Sphingobacterium faecale TaxID=2803775 RepID=A0ABS1R489_9SPHI|nr:hypothetical protein [Sphingobacterium faecale]MBL1409508.1 hypothetical protein [Sphingobacterium faecale]
MSIQVILIIAATVLIYGGIMYFTYAKKRKLKEAMQNIDSKSELQKAETYRDNFLSSEYSYLKKQMNGLSIDAFNFANLDYSNKSAIKDGLKDSLRSAATLGTVRYQTVQTPKYLLLSGDDLHLLDTDTEGDISNHLIFNSERLTQATLEEIPQKGTMQAFAKQKGDNVKAYRISLPTDGSSIELVLFSALVFTYATTTTSMFSMNTQKLIQENVIANDFLLKLGEKYPNMKVAVPLAS